MLPLHDLDRLTLDLITHVSLHGPGPGAGRAAGHAGIDRRSPRLEGGAVVCLGWLAWYACWLAMGDLDAGALEGVRGSAGCLGRCPLRAMGCVLAGCRPRGAACRTAVGADRDGRLRVHAGERHGSDGAPDPPGTTAGTVAGEGPAGRPPGASTAGRAGRDAGCSGRCCRRTDVPGAFGCTRNQHGVPVVGS